MIRHNFNVCFERDTLNEWCPVPFNTEKEKLVKIPSYMSKEFYINNCRKLTFMKHYGFKFHKSDLKAVEKLLTLSGFDLYIAVYLFELKYFRNNFHRDMKLKLKKWILSDDYIHPFNPKEEKILKTKNMWNNFLAKQYSIQNNYIPSICL